jgi:hypothetical protein
MLTKPKLSSLVASQLPEFVRSDYPAFVSFLQAYYDYLGTTQQDLEDLRDLDKTLDSFVRYFKDELASKLPYTTVEPRFLMEHIKEHYGAKGSEASFKLLFRILFGKEVTVDYPAKQMLRASDGKWNQDVSLFIKILTGHPNDPIGNLVDVVTPNRIIRVLVDRRQYVELEVDRVVKISDNVYEYYIDRRYFGEISIGDRLRYRDDVKGIYFTGEILATTSKLEVQKPGSGFKVGDLYNIKNFDGYGSIMKIARVDSNGGIAQGQFIKYGVGYTTDFTTTISAKSGQDVSGTAGTIIQRIDTVQPGGHILSTLNISEKLDGFAESGSINTADYNMAGVGETGGPALDGTFAGIVLREFGISSVDSTTTNNDPAIIKCSLGPMAKYPGYYVNNDGFLDDAIFIQDSRYYQAYSYVIKIDEALDSYKTAVKNLIHPAGMAIFGEYDIRNEFDISEQLESLVKILAVTVPDEVTATNLTEIKDFGKYFDDQTANFDGAVEGHYVTMRELGLTLDGTRTMPYLTLSKPIDGTNLNYDGDIEPQSISLADGGDVTDDTRTMPFFDTVKTLAVNHYINDGTTTDAESVYMLDVDGVNFDRTNPAFDQTKLLDSTHLNYDLAYDNETTTMVEQAIPYAGGGTRTGADIFDITKSLTANHYLNNNNDQDPELVVMSDTDAADATDLNRTTPAFVYTTTIDPSYYSGNDDAAATDSGGLIDINPYGEAGFFLNDGGLYVGNAVEFTG